MKNFILLPLLCFFCTSAAIGQEVETIDNAALIGIWEYAQRAEENLGFTMNFDGEKVVTEPEERITITWFLKMKMF